MAVIPIVIGALSTVPLWLETKTTGNGNQDTRRDNLDNSIVENSNNTAVGAGDLSRLAVT